MRVPECRLRHYCYAYGLRSQNQHYFNTSSVESVIQDVIINPRSRDDY